MSRLDSFIRRMQAQRACLNYAATQIAGQPGNILEFGLGNGRTYDHERTLFPDRDIYVFDRELAAHPDCIPPKDRVFLGDFRETLPQAVRQLGRNTILANLDVGSGNVEASRALARAMTPLVLQMLRPGAFMICDQPVDDPALEMLSLPDIDIGRHFFGRKR
jgi:hypothetical protein